MKSKIALLVIMSLFVTAISVYGKEQAKAKTEVDKLSYALGLEIGNDVKRLPIKVNLDSLLLGLTDSISEKPKKLSDDEISKIMAEFTETMAAKKAEVIKQLAEKNKKDSEAFLAENKKKEGVVTLPSGLQYKVIKEGSGKSPKSTDIVTVNYRGTFINGNEFDSSYRRNQPATFPVNGVIAGWSEALQLMKEGAKWQLFLPPNLAYGEKGVPNLIGPETVLIFEIELISVR